MRQKLPNEWLGVNEFRAPEVRMALKEYYKYMNNNE